MIHLIISVKAFRSLNSAISCENYFFVTEIDVNSSEQTMAKKLFSSDDQLFRFVFHLDE